MMESLLLVGCGPMAVEYAKVCKAMDISVQTVGRGEASAAQFQSQTGLQPATGGIHAWLDTHQERPARAIVAVGEKWLGEVTRQLLDAGIKQILVEKPGGLTYEDIKAVGDCAKSHEASVYVAYNRRFFAATQKARSLIKEDGGVTSFHFEFTEWGHVIAGLEKEEGVKEAWFLANSSHVIDCAYYLGGTPKQISTYIAGSLEWHPSAARFAGAGIAETGATFSYKADWAAPGRWSIEILTRSHRLILCPMEKLQVQALGSIAINEVSIDDYLDQAYKPGLYLMVKSFVEQPKDLPSIQEQVDKLGIYYDMQHGERLTH